MKQVTGLLALLAFSPLGLASDDVPQMVLDKVQFQVSAKQWVTTQTALLSVSVNVTLNSADLVRARADILNSLNKIAKGDWHLISFDRSQDNSGLEKLDVQAQVRVDQSALTDIYQNAKSVSIPGAKYEVSAIEFKPGLDETQLVRAKVRELLYQKINEEIARMNKVFPEQKYSLNNLTFFEGDMLPQPARAYQAKEMNLSAMAATPAPLAVSNELMLTAFVEAASNRKQGN